MAEQSREMSRLSLDMTKWAGRRRKKNAGRFDCMKNLGRKTGRAQQYKPI